MPNDVPMRFWIILLCALTVANVAVYKTVSAPKILTVTVFETGKSRATLVRTPNGKTLLVDTGPDASILRALGTALPPWQRNIDSVILTSEKAASTGGLSSILARYRVAETIRVGTAATPYGTQLTFDRALITVLAPERSKIDPLTQI